MSNFADPQAFFDTIYTGVAPWDIGAAQPALTDLWNEFPPAAPALDLGCGTGDHVFALAERGLAVTGIDFVASAIAQANERAAALPPEVAQIVTFETGDAFHLSQRGEQYRTIVDSGFLHLFEQEPRNDFARELAAALLPGGRYYLLAFAVEFDLPNTPRKVTEAELRERFTPEAGWRILTIRPAHFLNPIAATPAIAACIERL
jgi:ubiquinone/menaquinone biosynthesis C-methylase UbiE